MPTPVISVAQMRDWEAATWAGGQTEAEVIRQVGQRVAQFALHLTRPGDAILLLAGPGHNGDDVRAAQPGLTGRQVELLEIIEPAAALPKLESALAKNPALFVDGLFGIGLNRPLADDWINFINHINATRIPVLAVDVPSGLNADTGETFGAAIRATHTLTVGAPKHGLLKSAAGPFVGQLRVATEIGLCPVPIKAELLWTVPQDFRRFPPERPLVAHKGMFGHLAVIAGSVGFHGAAVLATRGAQRAQPGLITALPMESAYAAVAAQLQAPMVRSWSPDLHFPGPFTAAVIGPGLAARDVPEELVMAVRKLWRDSLLPLIVDASALDWLPLGRVPRQTLRVVTPHPGEAARLLKTDVAHIQADRVHAIREVSRHLGNCWVVLKGQHTLIGRDEGPVFINGTGNPQLAQGGSGDVLAGYLAGLLAQPALQSDPLTTLRYAVWQHGAAAETLQSIRRNWTIEDLAAEIGNQIPA